VNQLLKFYHFQLPPNDIKRDLVENIITNLILKDEIYVILFSLYSELMEDDITKLQEIQNSPDIL